MQYSELNDHGVILEYQLPMTSKRLDCMICGTNESGQDNAVIVELKQWEKCTNSNGQNEVSTWVGGAHRDVLHPSVQVGQYKLYLEDTHTAFYSEADLVRLDACVYLHNYSPVGVDVLFDEKFKQALDSYPLFAAGDVEVFKKYLGKRLKNGQGMRVLEKVEESYYRPSKKLMDHVGNIIKGKSEYVLLDEQLIVYDKVFAEAKSGFHDNKQTVIIVKGGPGTGKSVIAINLMADLLLQGFNAHYATGSKAFTETLRKIIGTRGSAQFKYFNSYTNATANEIDVLIADEAHRIRTTSNSRFTRKDKKSTLSQIDELLHVSKVAVFLIDDHQVVRPNEIGSTDYIKTQAEKNGSQIYEYELEAQFRCSGSEAFVNWINNTLGIKRTANVLWESNEPFDFKIFPSPQSLEDAIREKASQGHSARLAAGFCWPWSEPNPDGTLKDDVIIGDYRRPWDAKPDARKLAPGIPPASLWAHDPNGINQIGCVYTAQGFEFDYAGVIVGTDLIYDFDKQAWEGHPERSSDSMVKRAKTDFLKFVQNTYRVLLTRGLKGCYVHFLDKDTERFFRSRIETTVEAATLEISILKTRTSEAFKSELPLYSLKVAAGSFGKSQSVEPEGWIKVGSTSPLDDRMFVARVSGESMEPRIPNKAYCVFRFNPVGSRQNKIVLAQYRGPEDPETGGSFTIKKYKSEKVMNADGTWAHVRITLSPINPNFEPIVLNEDDEGQVQVIAEFISVLRSPK